MGASTLAAAVADDRLHWWCSCCTPWILLLLTCGTAVDNSLHWLLLLALLLLLPLLTSPPFLWDPASTMPHTMHQAVHPDRHQSSPAAAKPTIILHSSITTATKTFHLSQRQWLQLLTTTTTADNRLALATCCLQLLLLQTTNRTAYCC